MDEVNLMIRQPIGGGKADKRLFARIKSVPAGGRLSYTAWLIRYSTFTTADPDILGLDTTVVGGSSDPTIVRVLNMLESLFGSPFLGIDDEVELIDRLSNQVYLCKEFPRGYLTD